MNRRSVLRWLGLAPAVAPAAVAAASSVKPATERALDAVAYEPRAFSFDGHTLRIPNLSEGNACITSETEARAQADAALASRIDGVMAHLD